MFHSNNFDRCPSAVYEQLKASLRLASQFLTHPSCLRYWITLFFGTHHHDPALSQKMGFPAYRLPSLEEYSDERASLTLQCLEEMTNHVSFDFRSKLMLESVECYAITRCESKILKRTHQYLPTKDTESRQEWNNLLSRCATDDNFDPMKIHTRIHLSMGYYSYAEYLRKLTYADEAVKLRFNPLFAISLCHEIAHGVKMRRRLLEFGRQYREAGRPIDRTPFLRISETFLYDWNEAEAGRGFEMTTFGSLVPPINERCDGAAGLHTQTFPWPTRPEVFHAVRMVYINSTQQQSFWVDHSVSEITRLLKVPKTGVPTVLSTSMTTLSWKEYLHLQEQGGEGPYHVEDPLEPRADDAQQAAESQSSDESGEKDQLSGSTNQSSSTDNSSLPASPTDQALKKPIDLTVADKWKLVAQYFVLEGGLSAGFHIQRAMGTLMLPEKLQPWNSKFWQQDELNSLLYLRASKKTVAATAVDY